MSQVAMYRTRLDLRIAARGGSVEANRLLDMLRRAVQMVADKHGGSVGQAVRIPNGGLTTCDFAVVAPSFPNGIGIVINKRDGTMDLVCDSSYRRAAQEISDVIVQFYVTIACIRALKSLGYKVQEEPMRQQAIALTAVM